MSGWHALNIESDDESDIEVDDTKELQIEDALKLYQIALKYHAEGPDSFEEAAEAYQQLFESEIFRYPESQPELRRIELYGPLVEDDGSFDSFEAGTVAAAGTLDTGPSTLPQILHLSHKNYAQFKLEYLTARLDTLNVTLSHILGEASAALEHFVQALDKDDSDLDLWRRTAAVGGMLDSKRVARFCLEAVLEGDDDGLNGVLSLPGLEEGLAGEQLRELVGRLDDQLSMLQSPLSTGKRRVLSKMLKQRLSAYPHITERAKVLVEQHGMPGQRIPQPRRVVLKAPTTWAEMGDTLLRQLMAEQHGTSSVAPGSAIGFDLGSVLKSSPRAVGAPYEPMISKTTAVSAPIPQPHRPMPMTILEQFPGLDDGKPTVQPRIAPADASMVLIVASASGDDIKMADSSTMTLPSRKRSGDAAGLQEGNEEGRTKSRRTRARETNAETGDNRQALIDANIRWEYEQQLNEFQAADDWMFDTVGGLFERIGIVGFGKAKDVRQEINAASTYQEPRTNGDSSAADGLGRARTDVLSFLSNYTDQMAFVLLQRGESLDIGPSQNTTGFSGSFGQGSPSKAVHSAASMPNDGLVDLLEAMNSGWLLTQEAAYMWLFTLLQPKQGQSSENSYLQYLWPETLKTMVVRTLVNFDDSIYDRTRQRVADGAPRHDIGGLAEAVETILELHLDIYTLIKQPHSGVDNETITTQGDRLQRWSDLAREAMHSRSIPDSTQKLEDELSLRFLWATTFNIASASDVSQDYVIECMSDLRAIFVAAGKPTIPLQNNAVMPELTVAALDREISRLTTKDFFLKVTSQDLSDPVAVIEGLEPLLHSIENEKGTDGEMDGDMEVDEEAPAVRVPRELVRFLQSSNLSVRLLLWQRLRDAYSAIDYKPMVVSSYFRMMRMVLDELKTPASNGLSQPERQISVLKSLRLLQDMVIKTLTMVQSSDDALECIDEAALKAAVNGFGEILQLLQVFNVHEDSMRVGQTQPPMLPNGATVPSFAAANAVIHDMQLHIWIILYHLLKEAIYQNSDLYPTPAEDKFDFLRCVHRNLGIRGICGGSNRAFVRLLKDEFVHMKHVEGYDSEQAQVLYDLHGLNCFLNPSYELIEHHCTHDAFLDRGAAMQAVDLLLAQASKLPIKDLVKHSLNQTIEKVHGAVPRKKPTEAMLRNREIYRSYLRSPINPLDIFNCLKGEGNQLPVSPVPREDAVLAAKGWYFLMGHIALTKFRSQKRTTPTPTEDVDIAIAFFMQDLEYSMDKWETWFRLAQAYDTKIEESVVWSAEKLNNSMPEIVQLQRAAIHCYTMATALAYRSAEVAFETSDKMTELYSEFAMRLYNTSREPFSMLPFGTDEVEKFLSMPTGMGKGKPYASLRVYTAWKLAKVLLCRAIAGKQRSWTLHYLLGKCLWKMHAAPDHVRQHDEPPSAETVVATFLKTIDLLPDKKDSREKREPTLEPHYKLVTIVHKLVSRGELSLEQARQALDRTPYARTVTFPRELDEWVPHVLTVLKTLRAADKSNWHHRMIARAAQIIYDDSDPRAEGARSGGHLGAMGAKHELTQQMFTKTMVLQVWRPECERAGRHFVYTARYTRFFTRILEQLKDRPSLEALARRVRRRPHDVFEHGLVWQEICNAYLRLLRNYAGLPEGLETSTFSNIAHEDFLMRKEPLERWMQAQDTGTSASLDVLREVQELKKINQSLMKPGPIDDLIGDSYAHLFNTIGKQLWDEEQRTKREEDARKLAAASPPRNPMMSLNHLMNLDGAPGEGPTHTQTVLSSNGPPAQSELPVVRKKIGVGRREIRTCAEACVQKASAVPAARSLAASGTRVQVVIDNSRPVAGDASAETSAPGSIHDSADDESELSELEEEGDEEEAGEPEKEEGVEAHHRPMFPGLANTEDSREGSQGFETADEGSPVADGDVDMGDAAETALVNEQVNVRTDEDQPRRMQEIEDSD
ncbi:hypothetical protein LTR36_008264 [Oleoguttula mirabilis]|uniref:Histone transcription regulator 3 homolog n=1 Tax=Oleoguttula mirabilis TaxID=1507867 RepID=A0AAV9J8K8_9PEZI|nr:hypothetical protein LTR36_008264 [Oleoguttula mirabilis]